jgi:hypothetical protein
LIGNGTTVDLKFEFKDYGKGKYPGLYPQAVRVLDYKEYVPQHFAPLSEDDPYAAKDFEQDFGLAEPGSDVPEDFPE